MRPYPNWKNRFNFLPAQILTTPHDTCHVWRRLTNGLQKTCAEQALHICKLRCIPCQQSVHKQPVNFCHAGLCEHLTRIECNIEKDIRRRVWHAALKNVNLSLPARFLSWIFKKGDIPFIIRLNQNFSPKQDPRNELDNEFAEYE